MYHSHRIILKIYNKGKGKGKDKGKGKAVPLQAWSGPYKHYNAR
jgi:hypothetical protein